jgi:hypothetical protein
MRKAVLRFAVVAIALCSGVFVSFPSFPRTLGGVSKPQVVDRALKGDRLIDAPAPAKPKTQQSLERALTRVPMGCDRAFSSTAAPQFSSLFGRCTV